MASINPIIKLQISYILVDYKEKHKLKKDYRSRSPSGGVIYDLYAMTANQKRRVRS